jgi:hypothetical protein
VSERPARRKQILASLVQTSIQARVYTTDRRTEKDRAACLRRLAVDLIGLGATRLVIESREGRDQNDRHALYPRARDTSMAYEHLRPHEEPMLWAADAIAWTAGAGGHWTKHLRDLLAQLEHVRP